MSKIWLSSPHMGSNELKYVQDAFATNWIAPLGPYVDNFENAIANYTGVGHAAALSSGTAAIHLSLILHGIGQDDFVVCQSMTFSASANPIRYLGAVPVFVDSEPETWNMDPDALREAIKFCLAKGKKPKAIIPVHLYGMPAKMTEIINITQTYHIPIIEDAAESLGSKYNGLCCGSFGEMSILSFNGNKIITTSSGGALVSKNIEYVEKARFLSTQARDTAIHYQHSQIGYNYRMSNVLASIGRGQMQVLNERVGQRRANNLRYREFFKKIDYVKMHTEPSNHFYSNFWLTAFILDKEKSDNLTIEIIQSAFMEENIECRPLWKPMHLQPVFQNKQFYGTGVCERFFDNGLCLPSGSNLTDSDFDRIFGVLSRIFKI